MSSSGRDTREEIPWDEIWSLYLSNKAVFQSVFSSLRRDGHRFSADDAPDYVHEFLVERARTALRTYQPEKGAVAPWLFVVFRRFVLAKLQSQQGFIVALDSLDPDDITGLAEAERALLDERGEATPDAEASDPGAREDERRRIAMSMAIAELPPSLRRFAEMVYLEDLPLAEVSRRLNVRQESLRVYRRRAVEYLGLRAPELLRESAAHRSAESGLRGVHAVRAAFTALGEDERQALLAYLRFGTVRGVAHRLKHSRWKARRLVIAALASMALDLRIDTGLGESSLRLMAHRNSPDHRSSRTIPGVGVTEGDPHVDLRKLHTSLFHLISLPLKEGGDHD